MWILGSSRSGSTWLLRMIAELPAVHPVNETHIGHHLGVWRPIALAWATADRPPPLSTMYRTMASHPAYVLNTERAGRWRPPLRQLAEVALTSPSEFGPRPGARTIVAKEPSGSEVADLLLDLFPRSRVLFLVRDGRDVATSWLAAYQEGGWILDEGGYVVDQQRRQQFLLWQADVWRYRTERVQSCVDALPASQSLTVRYEDLSSRPTEQLRRIYGFIGEPFDDHDVEQAVERHAIEQVPSDRRGDRRHIRRGVAGSWREELTEEEQRALGDRLAPVLARYGYC